jgi:hypothetical protein
MANLCDNLKKHILVPLQGIPGPQGPQGPQGVPGASVAFPIAASNISVTNPGYTNLQELLDDLLYNPLVINSFTTTISAFEIGVILSSLTFNWTLSRNPIAQQITGPSLTPPSLLITDRTKTVVISNLQGTNPGDSFSYTLTTTDEVAQATRLTSIGFYNGIYSGDRDIPGAINSAFINSLQKTLQASKVSSWNSVATGSQYVWFCSRVALGPVTFYVGQFQGGFEAPVTVSHTNLSGFTENYYVYRSTNPGIGPVTITTN